MNKTGASTLNFYVVTWNVSTKFPDNISLNALLGLENNQANEKDTDLPDFYVIGLQEINSHPQNVVMGLFKDDPWTQKFKDLLKSRNYVVVKTEQMQGLLIILFAKRKHLLHLREIEAEYTRTGLGGIWGNKGAVSIRMSMYGCSVCLVNAHLAAHDHMLEDRIDDYAKILQEHKYHVKITHDIFSHDYVFWFGDLNFRLTGEATTSPEEIRSLVHQEKLQQLLEKDQLRLVISQKRAFHELTERIPAFPPTFKFEHGTSNYDMKRRPAWTDRILFKVSSQNYRNIKLNLNQSSYKSHPTYNISDHKPVSSEFIIQIHKKLTSTNNNNNYNDVVDGQVYKDHTEEVIEFTPIPIWKIGEENIIEYIVPPLFIEASSDWIGIYKEDFSSVNDYLSYEYTTRSQIPSRHPTQKRNINLTFPETVDLDEDGNYILIYFQSTGTRGVTGLAGISNVFRAEKRCSSPRFDLLD